MCTTSKKHAAKYTHLLENLEKEAAAAQYVFLHAPKNNFFLNSTLAVFTPWKFKCTISWILPLCILIIKTYLLDWLLHHFKYSFSLFLFISLFQVFRWHLAAKVSVRNQHSITLVEVEYISKKITTLSLSSTPSIFYDFLKNLYTLRSQTQKNNRVHMQLRSPCNFLWYTLRRKWIFTRECIKPYVRRYFCVFLSFFTCAQQKVLKLIDNWGGKSRKVVWSWVLWKSVDYFVFCPLDTSSSVKTKAQCHLILWNL